MQQQLQSWIDRLPRDLNDRRAQCLIALPIALIGGYAIIQWIRQSSYKSNLRRKIKARLQARDAEMEHVRELTANINPDTESKISTLDFAGLREALQSGEVSCLDALRVYQRKSLKSHELTNCVTGYIQEATANATRLDSLAKDPNYKKPPLFGMPLSIKSSVPIKGYEACRGYAHELGTPAPVDSTWVGQLKELGCVPFVFTNIPQSLLAFTCQNPIYGSTNMPLNREYSSGGSSGGEGAIIGSGGSLIGIGSDIGGSIRIPAAWCGCTGIKPTQGRITNVGELGSVPGRSHVFGSVGPLSSSVSGCVTILRHTWGVDQWMHRQDAYIPPVAWNEVEYASTRKLRIGFYDFDGYIDAMPSMRRAVAETRALLERAGHTLVPIEPPGVSQAIYLYVQSVLIDNGTYISDHLKNDIIFPPSRAQVSALYMPYWLRSFLSFVMRPISTRHSKLLNTYVRTPTELRQIYGKVEAYWLQWKKLMRDQEIDCLICPSFPTPSQRHNDPYWLTMSASYTALFNLLNFPAGVVPVTKVTEQDLRALKHYMAGDMFERQLLDLTRGTLGFPVAVQVAALPYHDETVLRVMAEIEALFAKHHPTPII